MEQIRMSDCTLKQFEEKFSLSFREKLDLCKLTDHLHVSAIELSPLRQKKVDRLLIRSICAAVENAAVAVPAGLTEESIRKTWDAVSAARHPRLQVSIPTSSVQMEYLYHMKPAAMLLAVESALKICRSLTEDVEFVAEDATRSDPDFLIRILRTAVLSGASTVTLCDSAGAMFPEETASFINRMTEAVPELQDVCIGFSCSDEMHLADACAVAAVQSGVRELKVTGCRQNAISLRNMTNILTMKGNTLNCFCKTNRERLNRTTDQIEKLFISGKHQSMVRSRESSATDYQILLSVHDDRETVLNAVEKLGYDLSPEDADQVWNAFETTASRKETVSLHELEAIVAAEAMQVPPVYTGARYVISSDNSFGAMSHMKLMFHGKVLDGISSGDGVIDAAFLSIEKATGRHFELDDFQIQAIAEGREALGETLVRLRSEGRLYSGRGISTDIVEASIMAYVNALNKIVYEEEET